MFVARVENDFARIVLRLKKNAYKQKLRKVESENKARIKIQNEEINERRETRTKVENERVKKERKAKTKIDVMTT